MQRYILFPITHFLDKNINRINNACGIMDINSVSLDTITDRSVFEIDLKHPLCADNLNTIYDHLVIIEK